MSCSDFRIFWCLVVHFLIFLIFTFISITQKLLVLQYWDTSLKAVNLAVLMSGRTRLWLFYVRRYRRWKMQKKISFINLANYLLNITNFYDHKKCRKLFYQTNFVLLLLAPFGISSQILKLKDQKIFIFKYFTHHWINLKRTPKNQKFECLSTTHKFYVDFGQKDIWVHYWKVMGGRGGLN